MAAQLIGFLDRYKGRPFAWGRDDCSLFIADWWREVHGVDPAAHLRGTYTTEREKDRIVVRAGGLLPLISSIAETAGAVVTETPKTGDFGIIEPGVCAIHAQGFWIARSETGLAFSKDVAVWRAWSI